MPLLVELEMTFALVWISFCYRWPLFCHFLSSILHSSLSWLYPSPFFLCLSHFSLSLSLLNAPPTSFSASLCKFGSSSYGNNFYVTRWVKCNIFKVKCLCLHTHTKIMIIFGFFLLPSPAAFALLLYHCYRRHRWVSLSLVNCFSQIRKKRLKL